MNDDARTEHSIRAAGGAAMGVAVGMAGMHAFKRFIV